MNDFFKDKKFEEMDWISQAVEPIEWSVNENLSKIPDVIEVDYPMLESLYLSGSYSWAGPNVGSIVQNWCHANDLQVDWSKLDMDEVFDLVVEVGTTLDLEKRHIDGRIQVVKLKTQVDNSKVQDMMADSARETLWNLDRWGKAECAARALEIADLCGFEQKLKHSRSCRKRVDTIRDELYTAIKEDRWRIRDVDLCSKIIHWVVEYVNTGNLAALANFAKFKVMTHNGQPIYSMKEVE